VLFNLLSPLADQVSLFNLFRYLTFRTGGAVLTALVISFVVGPSLIRWLRVRQGNGQPIRADGPASHLLRKQGTPTMGGTLILLALTMATLLWADLTNGYVWVVLLITLGFGGIGLADDYLKLSHRSSGGLRSRTKLLGQSLVALLAAAWIAHLTQEPLATGLSLPFLSLDFGRGGTPHRLQPEPDCGTSARFCRNGQNRVCPDRQPDHPVRLQKGIALE
jgi:phospho-N-acetylmuramoyl-pentapeptide-transferase